MKTGITFLFSENAQGSFYLFHSKVLKYFNDVFPKKYSKYIYKSGKHSEKLKRLITRGNKLCASLK